MPGSPALVLRRPALLLGVQAGYSYPSTASIAVITTGPARSDVEDLPDRSIYSKGRPLCPSPVPQAHQASLSRRNSRERGLETCMSLAKQAIAVSSTILRRRRAYHSGRWVQGTSCVSRSQAPLLRQGSTIHSTLQPCHPQI